MLSEKEKMLSGQAFNPLDVELRLSREAARLACAKYNAHPSKGNLRHIKRLFAQHGQIVIEPGFQCDYGSQISLGDNVYINFSCIFLDSANIEIGDNTFIGPGTHLYTVDHPRNATVRSEGLCSARPIVIGKQVWIGGGVKILPGVHIGDQAIIGANAVVNRDVLAGETYL
ncbi:sugar O-acetyltransferase [Marinomonas epiphytica]